MQKAAPPLIEHMEVLFGRIQAGFSIPEDLNATPGVQYVECKGGTVRNVTVISTIGLSRFELASSAGHGSHKHIHQELFVMLRDEESPRNIPAVLHQIVMERMQSRAAVLRGEVLRREGWVITDTNFVALYATLPVYYPDQNWICRLEGTDLACFCWLLPITDPECQFISRNGWSAFEDLLEQAKFDLFDLDRPALCSEQA
jgi:hypothetical protein